MASIEPRRNAAGKVTSWRVVWRDNGARQHMRFDREADALQWKALLEAAQHDTAAAEAAILRKVSTTPTFEEAAEHHIARLTRAQPDTITRYRRFLVTHTATLNGLPVDKIAEDDLIHWIRDRQAHGSSAKTIRNVHGLIHAVMDSAVRRRLRPDNPCNGRLLPRDNRTDDTTTFLTGAEFALLMEHMHPFYVPLFSFLIGTGLRLSEAAALTREDVDLDGPTPSVRVTKAWKEDRGGRGWYVGPPKTRKARRTVSLSPSLVEMIRPRVEAAAPGELVWTMVGGGEVRSGRLYARVWRQAVDAAQAAGLAKSPRIHDLRHSHASLMIAGGMNLYELAGRLGHESITTTADTYGHLVPDVQWRAAELAESAIPLGAPPAIE